MRKLIAVLLPLAAVALVLLQLPRPAPAQPAPGISFMREDKIDATCRTAAVRARIDKARRDNIAVQDAIETQLARVGQTQAALQALRGKPEFAAEAPALMEALVAQGREYDRLIAWQTYIHAIQRYYLNLPACPGDPPVTAPAPGPEDGPAHWPDTWSTPPPPPAPLPVPRCKSAATDSELAEVRGKLATLVPLRDTMIRTYWDDVAKSRAPGANPALRQNLAREWRKVSEVVEDVQQLQRRADVLSGLKPCVELPVECRTPEQEAELKRKTEELIQLDKDIQALEARRRALRNDINQLEMMDACPCPDPQDGLRPGFGPSPPPPPPPPPRRPEVATPPALPPPPPPPKGRGKGNDGGGGQTRSGVLSGNVLQGIGVEVCPPPRTGKEEEPDN